MPQNDPIREALRHAGLRVTSTRVELLRALHAHDQPVSMDDASRICGPAAGDLATIYRNLQTLAEAGVLRTVRGVGKREMFEPAGRASDSHAHASCTRCGQVACMDIPDTPTHSGIPGWQITEVSVTAWGLCPNCATA